MAYVVRNGKLETKGGRANGATYGAISDAEMQRLKKKKSLEEAGANAGAKVGGAIGKVADKLANPGKVAAQGAAKLGAAAKEGIKDASKKVKNAVGAVKDGVNAAKNSYSARNRADKFNKIAGAGMGAAQKAVSKVAPDKALIDKVRSGKATARDMEMYKKKKKLQSGGVK